LKRIVHFICDADQPWFKIACSSSWERPRLYDHKGGDIFAFYDYDNYFGSYNEDCVNCKACEEWLDNYHELEEDVDKEIQEGENK